jgi:hypothetical protein
VTTKNKKIIYTCVVVPAAVVNGVISGLSGVITTYFFQPIWSRAMKWWNDQYK